MYFFQRKTLCCSPLPFDKPMVKVCYCQLHYKIETSFFNIQCGYFNVVNVSKELKNGFVTIDCVIIIGLDTAHCSSLTTFTGQEKAI